MMPLHYTAIAVHCYLLLALAEAESETCSVQNASCGRALLQKQLTGSQVEIFENETLGPSLGPRHQAPKPPVTDRRLALMARARSHRLNRSKRSQTEDLDSAVSAKIFDDIADGFESVGDGFSELGDTFEDIGEGIADVGLTVGSAVGNAATVVGNSVVEAAESTVDALPSEIKDAASTLGNAVVATGNFVADVGEVVADAAVDLAGDALQVAQYAVQEGAKVGSALGDKIATAANAIGDGIERVGALAVGLAKAAWEQIKAFINCLTSGFSLCKLMLGNVCDCDAGSTISMSTSGLGMRCVFKASGFSSGYGFSAGGSFEMGDKSSQGRIKIPGQTFVQSFKPKGDELKARQVALNSQKSKAPSGSCESDLDMALEGVVQFAPILDISVKSNGDTEVGVEGLARASLDGLIKAEGSCAFLAEKRFPKVPKSKVVCGPFFCIAIMLQMVAEVELKGVITGSVEVAASADFRIKGKVLINPSGKADVDFDLPSIEQKHGFGFAASASGSARIGMGPSLVIFPMPGVPITVNPMMNAEVRAMGTLNMPVGSLLQESTQLATQSHVNSSRVNQISLCGAAALNIYTDIEIQGFGLPVAITASLSTHWIQDAIYDAITQGAEAFVRFIAGPAMCIPGADAALDTVMSAAKSAATLLSGMIPDLHVDISTPSATLLAPTKLFCVEAVKSPGFDGSSCSQDLGCHSTGRPSSPMVTPIPPDQVRQTTAPSAHSPTCYSIPMGDRFIQLGDWRWAAIDDNHFSVSHKGGQTAQIYRNDGTLHTGPRTDYNAWGRSIGPAVGISFGYQFIQIGKFRLGQVNDNHFSISHKDGQVVQIFRNDGTLHPGPRTDHSTYDRPGGAATGIAFGDRFIQIGQFRIGDADGWHATVTHSGGQTIQIYRGDGTLHPGPRTDWTAPVGNRLPVSWTCQSLEEMAHGTCDAKFGTFGDRFIQLGHWRLAAMDGNHFSISHKDGQTAQIYRYDGTLHPGPRTDYNAWNRPPIGYPYGITFGPSFIQIGLFRLGMVDKEHFSIAHKYGYVSQIFRSDGTLHPGPRSDYDLWKVRSSGPASGITYGDRFLQIGKFRIGDADGWHMLITHVDGQTIQIYRGDGTLHPGPRTDWTHALQGRHPKWHCGNIQLEFGSCTGITGGGRWLQLGDWRIAGVDYAHFSISHRGGQTAQIYRSDGTVHPGPRTDYNVWGWQGEYHDTQVKFGDHFLQLGEFRLGQVDETHFSISHSGGQTIMIFRSDGTLHGGPRTDYNLWGKPLGEPIGVTFGDRFVQIGKFRLGDVDSTHFSVSHVGGQTIQIYRNDGTLYSGPRTDYTTFGRPLEECFVVAP